MNGCSWCVVDFRGPCVEVTFPEREGGYLGGKLISSELSSVLAGFS